VALVRLAINNRKLCEGFYQAIGIEAVQDVLRQVDKLDKIGYAAVHDLLLTEARLTKTQADGCLGLARIRTMDTSFAQQVCDLGAKGELLQEGLDELAAVLGALADLPPGAVWADLRVARGLDYYTGTVYETTLAGHESLGSICSGGRYDDLATGGNRRFPGVGVSIGVSRVLGHLLARGELAASRRTPTCVLVALPSEALHDQAQKLARHLRERGIPCEVFHEPVKFGKQIRYAARKGIPYVWFLEGEHTGLPEVRDLRSGEQHAADPDSWCPPEDDMLVRIEQASAQA
jgi:histidyl-tRNA synthetase